VPMESNGKGHHSSWPLTSRVRPTCQLRGPFCQRTHSGLGVMIGLSWLSLNFHEGGTPVFLAGHLMIGPQHLQRW